MEVITPNNGRQPWAIQGGFTERLEQMSHCPSLAWGRFAGGREVPGSGAGAHPVPCNSPQ